MRGFLSPPGRCTVGQPPRVIRLARSPSSEAQNGTIVKRARQSNSLSWPLVSRIKQPPGGAPLSALASNYLGIRARSHFCHLTLGPILHVKKYFHAFGRRPERAYFWTFRSHRALRSTTCAASAPASAAPVQIALTPSRELRAATSKSAPAARFATNALGCGPSPRSRRHKRKKAPSNAMTVRARSRKRGSRAPKSLTRAVEGRRVRTGR